MVNHILLRAVSISVSSYDASGGVGRAKIARYIQTTQKTAGKRLQELITSGHVSVVKVPANRGYGFKYLYNLTSKGCEYLEKNWDRVNADYQAWQNHRLLEEIEAVKKPIPTKKSKKQIKQENDGQRSLF